MSQKAISDALSKKADQTNSKQTIRAGVTWTNDIYLGDEEYKISFNNNGDLTYNGDKVMVGSTVSNEVSLVQNIGQSTTAVMSQKAVTEISNKVDKLDQNVINAIGYNETIIPIWTTKKRIGEDGKEISSSDVFAISDYIEIVANSSANVFGCHSYKPVAMPSVHLYSADKTHIGFLYIDGNAEISEDIEAKNAKYIRLSHYTTNVDPLENVRIEYAISGEFVSEETLKKEISKIPTPIISYNKQYENVLKDYKEYSVVGKYWTDRGLINNPNWVSITELIPIDISGKYVFGRRNQPTARTRYSCCFFDENKTYISQQGDTENVIITIPSNCKYIGISHISSAYSPLEDDNFDFYYLVKADVAYTAPFIEFLDVNSSFYPKTSLYGKKWFVFGDSITEHNIRSKVNYHDYVRVELNIFVEDKGVGGSGYKNRDDNNNSYYQLVEKCKAELSSADIITIMGGVNDCTRGSFDSATGLGEINDTWIEPEDETIVSNNTIFACFKHTIDKIIRYAPNAKLGVISPLPACPTNDGRNYVFKPSDSTNNMSRFVEGCKTICSWYGIPYLDLYHNSGLRPWDDDFNAKYFSCPSADSPDRLHPNEYGHKWIYPMVREFIKKLL